MTGGSDEERQKALDGFDEAVNMTAGELEKWLGTDESREVGQKDGGGESTGHAERTGGCRHGGWGTLY